MARAGWSRQLEDLDETRAQEHEDVLLWGVFAGQTPGFVMRAGAFDGYRLSVSYLFECVGWSGLLVEPLQDHADACRTRRTYSRTVQAALSGHGRASHGIFTRVVSDEFLSYLKITDRHSKPKRLQRETEVQREVVRVPVLTLDAVLEGYEGTMILSHSMWKATRVMFLPGLISSGGARGCFSSRTIRSVLTEAFVTPCVRAHTCMSPRQVSATSISITLSMG